MGQKIDSLWLGLCFCILVQSCMGDAQVDQLKDTLHLNTMYDLALEPKLNHFQSISEGHVYANDPPTLRNKALEHLGHTLYYEKMLYGGRSCNSCHNLSGFGIENKTVRVSDSQGKRNMPSVLNAVLDTVQFWHGNAGLDQHMRLHMKQLVNESESEFMSRFQRDSVYEDLFRKAFSRQERPLSYRNLLEAVTAFEKKLKTPSPFDRYLDGELKALSLQQKKGLLSFINVGCVDCHSGASVGGDITQKFGVFDEYWKHTGFSNIDEGLYEESRKSKDKYVFAVPSLRNVDMTGPYFHDGSVHELRDAVKIMAKIQLDYTLNEEELENITMFLRSLKGDSLPLRYRSAPDPN